MRFSALGLSCSASQRAPRLTAISIRSRIGLVTGPATPADFSVAPTTIGSVAPAISGSATCVERRSGVMPKADLLHVS